MLLRQISVSDQLTQSVITAMLERSTVLQYAQFYSMTGNADYMRKSPTASGGQFRALNSDYSANIVNPQFADVALKIFGGKVEIDRAHERRGQDVASVRAMELLNFARNLGKNFQKEFFNANGTGDTFTGLKLLIPSSQKLTPATDGIQVPLGNSDTAKSAQQKFLEWLDTLIETVDGGPQVLFANGALISRLTAIAREYIDTQMNEFGVPVKFYNGIPIVNAGYAADGSLVIPNNEICGTSTDCTSIYAVRFGEKADLTIATNIGVEVKDLGLVGAHYIHSVEFDACPILLNDKSVARLEGIRLP